MQRELGDGLTLTAAYVGSQGRNLFLRSVGNQIVDVVTNPNPATAAFVIREFSLVERNAAGQVTRVQNPYAEVDFKTSGGHDEYNAMMLSLNRRSASGLAMNLQYTLGRSRGTSGGSNEANTAGNNARTLEEFEDQNGYNNFDVRHTFNLSVLYSMPFGRGRKYGSDVGVADRRAARRLGRRRHRQRAQRPAGAGADRPPGRRLPGRDRQHLRQPGGGPHRDRQRAGRRRVAQRAAARPDSRRRPVHQGRRPPVPEPGRLRDAGAGHVRQPGAQRNSRPGSKQVDMFFAKHFNPGGRSDFEFRVEVFNLFDTVNFANPIGTLPQAIPTSALTEAGRLQPGEPYTAAAAGTFGRLSSTVGRTVGLGTPRQMQFAVRFSF